MADPWEDPVAERWISSVLEDMEPKLSSSVLVAVVVPEDREGDVKLWVELGASIMFDKPIIALMMGAAPVPSKLARVADEIVPCPEGVEPGATTAFKEAFERVLKRRGVLF